MSIEFNFGWLNDYTGSRFAPFTVANCVLMDTSTGSTETLFDYVQLIKASSRKNFDFLKDYAYDHERRLRQLTWTSPAFTNPETGKVESLSHLGVHYAEKLTTVGEQGGVNNVKGTEKGGKNLPIFFHEGVPVECYEKKEQALEIPYANIWSNVTSRDKFPDKADGKTLATTDGGATSALNVDISGIAAHALLSNEAYLSEVAKFAANAKLAEESDGLSYDVHIGRAYKENKITPDDKTQMEGDVWGTIPFKSGAPDMSAEVLPAPLELKQLLNFTGVQSYGQYYQSGTLKGTLFIPSFKLDNKGRITEIQDYQYNVNLKLDKMADRTDINTAYLVAVNGPASDNPNYIYSQGNPDSQSIYIQWAGEGVSEPILMGAAWNDYAEYRTQKEEIEAGYCVKSNDDGKVELTTERLSICDGIVSDTFGFSIGKSGDYQTPLAVSGRVLAYCEGETRDYHAGDVVCASENGKVSKMTREEIREYPDRIVGTVSEIPSYEKWNDKEVHGRIWIKVK